MHWTHLNLAKQSKWVVWLNLTEILLVSSSSNDLSSYRWVLGDAWLFSELEILRYVLNVHKTRVSFVFTGEDLRKKAKQSELCLGI